ncbi:site-specific DNA-methyltransferase [Polaribacter pectinis]|uniref:site-specific DNA-methyltransferase (adenine-specific) n=1 Tax=Polaribacter pectinis TaxID=2738844 RepID=A0A7G9L8G6_9FLAO|nr:site-specific DNA-methyltransferase [Polaribacter pectinis]QNM84915.1 site-specific DNA-methyltransferase [Polaribacter pectinis]
MNKIDHNDPLSKSADIVSENIQQLQQLFPEVFKEGKIDWQELQATLGDHIDAENERFSFSWNGKSNARKEAQKPSTGTLRPAPEESVDWENTQNLYIEGDNLEVLKLLQKSYHQKVKMIYIDPPYNTGKDFVYKDNYKDNLSNYLELTGQKDEDGRKLSTNSDASGRYHSNWLNMMYPRLKLARNLLTEDGVIFISIDDNEVDNLRKICNEIFGEENFISQAGWQKVYSPKNQARYLSNDYEFVLIYAKHLNNFQIGLLPRTEKMNKRYKNLDSDSRGNWKSGDLVAAGERTGGHYIIKNPTTGEEYDVPQGKHWAYSEPKMRELLIDNRIYFGKDGTSFPSSKQFLSEVKQGRVASSFFSYTDYGHTDEAKKDFIKLFGESGKTIFETLKPVRLIENLMRIANVKANDVFIDFFSGSSTSAQSVMNFNLKEELDIKHIQVQFPEPTEETSEAYKFGYKTIAEIGKQRIKLAGKKITEEHPEKAKDLDLGFKVFKLDSSNIKAWSPEAENLEQNLLDAVENIKEGRSESDLLFEILLKYGLDLTLPITEHEIAGAKVFNVGAGALLVCLADNITVAVAEGIAELKKELNPEICRVVFKDNGFKDSAEKTNVMQKLKQHNIEEVRSI